MGTIPENVNPAPQIEETPKPQISEAPAGQTLEQPTDPSVTLSDIMGSPDLQKFVKDAVKQQQDVRFGKYGTRLDKLESPEGAVAEYLALTGGGTPDPQALATMSKDIEFQNMKSIVEKLQGGNAPVPSPGGGEQKWENQEATILNRDGIEKNDPRLVELLRSSTYKSHDEYVKDLNEKAFTWRQADAKKPVADGSTIAQTIKSVPSGDGTYTVSKYSEGLIINVIAN